MANRQFQQFQGTVAKGIVKLFARVNVAGAGAVTLKTFNSATGVYDTASSSGADGIKSVTRTDTGKWSILLQDSYQRAISVIATTQLAGAAPKCVCAAINTTGTDVRSATAPTLCIGLVSATDTLADPDSGDLVDLEITLQNSTAI